MKALLKSLKGVALAALTAAFALGAQAAEPCTDCITFSASESFGIRLNKGTGTGVRTPPTVKLEYSTDQLNWQTFNVDTDYAAANVGGTYLLHIRGKDNNVFAAANGTSAANVFTNTAVSVATAIACSGNIMTLLDWEKVKKGENVTVGKNAFASLFEGCTSLTAAPTLPAMTLEQACYNSMFKGCTSLTTPPELPATTLADYCYNSMFFGCTSLTAAPELPATDLPNNCYGSMFSGCTSLTDIPALDVAVVTNNCCRYMFMNCSNLVVNTTGPGKEWKIPSTVNIASATAKYLPADQWTSKQGKMYWATNMFEKIAGEKRTASTLDAGAEIKPGTTYYIASAPAETNCITFSADKSFGIKMVKGEDAPTVNLEYSTDQLNWKTFTAGTTEASAANVGGTYKLHFRGKGNKQISIGIFEEEMDYFATTADSEATAIACSGNVMTLLDWEKVAKGEEPTMGEFSLACLFFNFTSLTAAPELPATTLANACYGYMFAGCTSLTAAPELPVKTLANACYNGMFNGCTSLTAAPELPAKTLAYGCYSGMFSGCESLTAAPELPATTLADRCYDSMFYGCTSLTVAPELPAKTLANYCYFYMFYGCTSLVVNKAAPGKDWKIAATPDTGATSWGYDMFTGTGGDVTGTPDLNTTYSIASAPKETECITFSADKSFGIRMDKGKGNKYYSEAPAVNLQWSTDYFNWQTFAVDQDYAAANVGGTYQLHIRGTANNTFAAKNNKVSANIFTNTAASAAAAIACSGNIMTLLDWGKVKNGEDITMMPYTFSYLFSGFTSLTAAPVLPATTLTEFCYHYMFFGCKSLPAAPALPATKMARSCYSYIFSGCKSLTEAPALSATTLADRCYEYMFYGCTSLPAAPALPATTMRDYCYNSMFNGCKSLTAAPDLPAKTLADSCYNSMFNGCASLTAAPALPATTLPTFCYQMMFRGCTLLKDIPALDVSEVTGNCCKQMFANCSNLVVNTTGPGKEWKIPSTAKIASDDAKFTGKNYWATNMFANIAGEQRTAKTLGAGAEIVPGTTYYIAPTEPMQSAPTALAHATAAVYTNDVLSADGIVWSNRLATVVYTADDGYLFADGVTVITNELDTTVDPAVNAGTAPDVPKSASVAVTIDGVTTKYLDVKNAWNAATAAAQTTPVTMKLLEDVEAPYLSALSGISLTLDLNDHVLKPDATCMGNNFISLWCCEPFALVDTATTKTPKYFAVDKETGLWVLTNEVTDLVVEGGIITGAKRTALVVEGDVTIRDVAFVGNSDTGSGAALTIDDGELNVYGARFFGNVAEGAGGAIYVEDDACLLMKDCEVRYNVSGVYGGGICAYGFSTLLGTVVTDNRIVIAETEEGVSSALAIAGGGVHFGLPSWACVAAGTLIRMADGTEKKVEDVVAGDVVRTFDHEAGCVSSSKVFLAYKGKRPGMPFTLTFDGGLSVSFVGCHDLLEETTRTYVTVTAANAKTFIGKRFYGEDGQWHALAAVKSAVLPCAYYSIYTAQHLNSFANGLLTAPDDVDCCLNMYALDSSLKADAAQLEADIAQFGLVDFGEASKKYGISKQWFDDANVKYNEIIIGKGLASRRTLERLYASTQDERGDAGVVATPARAAAASGRRLLKGDVEPTAGEYYEEYGENKMVLGANTVITNNLYEGAQNNIGFATSEALLALDTDHAGLRAGVTSVGYVGPFTTDSNVTAADAALVTSDNCRYTTVYDEETGCLNLAESLTITQQPTEENGYEIAATVIGGNAIVNYCWAKYTRDGADFHAITNLMASLDALNPDLIDGTSIKSDGDGYVCVAVTADDVPPNGEFRFTCTESLVDFAKIAGLDAGTLKQEGTKCTYVPKVQTKDIDEGGQGEAQINVYLMALIGESGQCVISNLEYVATSYDPVAEGKNLTRFPTEKGELGSNYVCRVVYGREGSIVTNDCESFMFRGFKSNIAVAANPAAAGTVVARKGGTAVTGAFWNDAIDIVATTNRYWQFAGWTGVDELGDVVAFDDAAAAETTFKMHATNVAVTANFVVSEVYRAEYKQKTDDDKETSENSVEALRGNRLTDEECDEGLRQISSAYDTATNRILTALTPADVKSAASVAKSIFRKIVGDRTKISRRKPHEAVIANDFTRDPFQDIVLDANSNVWSFVYGGTTFTNGVNAFHSFREAYAEKVNMPFVTTVYVFGAQTISSEPTQKQQWNLNLVSTNTLGKAIVTVAADPTKKDPELFDITKTLGKIKGEGTIILGKKDADVHIYDEYIEGKIDVKAADVDAVIDKYGNATVNVKPGVSPGEVKVAGIENLGGDITISNRSDAAVILAGKIDATTNNNAKIVHDGIAEMRVLGSVIGKDVTIAVSQNVGKLVIEQPVIASRNANITLEGTFDGTIMGKATVSVKNLSHFTMIGRYEATDIVLTGDNGGLSNVTFAAKGGIAMHGTNVLTGPLTIESGAATNFGTLAWSCEGSRRGSLADWESLEQAAGVKFEIRVDAQPENMTCVLARNAAAVAGTAFVVKGSEVGDVTVIAGGETVYPGAKAFTLAVTTAGDLVFAVSDGRFGIAAKTQNLGDAAKGDGGTAEVVEEAIVGTDVAVTATPAEFWQFNCWTGEYAHAGVTNDVTFADATAAETTFEMPVGEVSLVATFALSETYRAEQLAAVSNAAEAAVAEIRAKVRLSEAEQAPLVEAVEGAYAAAAAAIAGAIRPEPVQMAVADALAAFADILDEAEGTAEAKVRFESRVLDVTEGQTLDVVVYGGSIMRTTAAKLTYVRKTYLKTPKAYMEIDGKFKRVRFPLTLDWAKGDREPKTVRLVFSKTSAQETDRFFTLQLGSEVASETGPYDVCQVTVKDQKSEAADPVPFVRALAWPANGGKVSGAGYLKRPNSRRTLTAKANKWATFAGWYKADASAPNDFAKATKVSDEKKLVVEQGEAGTYFAYFTEVTKVIAVKDPDFSAAGGATGISTNETGVATCTVGFAVSFAIEVEAAADSRPKLSVTKLPNGLRFDRKTGLVTGVPKKAGTYVVKATGKNAAGKHTLTFKIVVKPMPEELIGTFAGDLLDAESSVVGAVTVKVTKQGRVGVRVTVGKKTYGFSARGLSAVGDAKGVVIEKNGIGTVAVAVVADGESTAYAGSVEGAKFGDGPLTFTAVAR